MHILRAIAAAVRAVFSAVWVLVRTPLGLIWRRSEPPVTPAEAVAFGSQTADIDADGLTPSQARIDQILRDYIMTRFLNARRPAAERETLPDLRGVPASYACWARRLTDAEVKTAIGVPKPLLARHLEISRRDGPLPCAFLPPVLPEALYKAMDRADSLSNDADKAAASGKGKGGGPKGLSSVVSAQELDNVLADFRERVSHALDAPRPR